MTREEANYRYGILMARAETRGPQILKAVMRQLALEDLFFLLTKILRRPDANNEWCYTRCREVQAAPDGYLDLWAREHYKSTIITFALTIQDILKDPDITVGIFSHTRPIAKAFLRQIKREFEDNKILLDLFPDIVWDNPHRDSPKWSEDEGIILRRFSNPKEATVEAWGLVDGQPVSKHYRLMVYDDVVTRESITNSDMIQKVTKAWEDSRNLTVSDGTGRTRHIGTRWHFADTYRDIIRRGAAIPRIYTEADENDVPLLWSPEVRSNKRKEMGPYVWACQIKQNPKMDTVEGFEDKWLQFWPADTCRGMNVYILCDPAGEKKKENDYTVFWVIGLACDMNYYGITMVRDRLNLVERANMLFNLHRRFRKDALSVTVGYEKYGMQSDIEHYEDRMRRDNYRFRIIPLGGPVVKNDRIKRLIPLFDAGRIFLPDSCHYKNYEGERQDLVQIFLDEEYRWFPFPVHDDMLDCLARIMDPDIRASFPDESTVVEMSKYTHPFMAHHNEIADSYNPLRYGIGG